MKTRRILLTVSALVLALLAGLAPAATAVVAGPSQAWPSTTWVQPGTDPLDGVGAWVYVAPGTAPVPSQTSAGGYEYLLRFNMATMPPQPAFGFIGLSTRPDGSHYAGLVMVSTVVQPTARTDFDWAPGHFYYLLVYGLGADQWVGWVYDYTASSWTVVGQVTAPGGSGRLSPTSGTSVDYESGAGGSPLTCAGYPRTDAFFYPPVGYRGSTVTLATLGAHSVNPGDCPTTTTIEYDWVHYGLGVGLAA